MVRDASSHRPRPVRAGAAPTGADSAALKDRFPVALTVEDDDGVRWDVRVAGRALAGRAQAGGEADCAPELVLLVFSREGSTELEREALLPGAGLRDADGALREVPVLGALEGARPYGGGAPRGDGFFDGTRRRRDR